MRIYDATVPISEFLPVWPGEPRVQIEALSRIQKGDPANVSALHMSCHTGTHVDAPHHFFEHGITIDKLPPEVMIGHAFVAEVHDLVGNGIEVYDLARLHFPQDTTRLLIKSSNSYFWEDKLNEFEPSFVHLTLQAAEWLVKRGVRLVGVDYLSVEPYGVKDARVHHTLLGAGVVVVEGLDLSRVPEGPCQLVCLPLKVQDGDGAPARVLILRD